MNKTGYIEEKKSKGRVYPKGEEVEYTTREGEKALYPNAHGSHLVRVPGKGLQNFNRTESRAVNRRTPATKSNYWYQHDKLNFNHDVSESGQGKRARKFATIKRPPGVSNHTAHKERQIMREIELQNKKEKANATS